MDDPILALILTAGASLAVAIPCLLAAYLCRRRRKAPVKPAAQHLPVSVPAAISQQDSSSSWSFYGSSAADSSSSLANLSLADLAAATGGFAASNIIGDGSFGFVYRAVLPDGGGAVAVKRLATHGAAGNREFRAELEVLGSLSHPNLARLLGYCAAGADRILVYELLERGSLDAWLHGDGDDDAPCQQQLLTWPARLRVARGVAAALAFLHHDRRPPVLHRDIKASNVLLGDGFEAKLADFGLARVVKGSPAASHVSTQAAGTAGIHSCLVYMHKYMRFDHDTALMLFGAWYVAPEIWAGVGATAKADVYSFGILMIEIVTGHRPSWPVKPNVQEKEEVDLVDWAREKIQAGKASEVLDCRIGIDEWQGKEAEEMKGVLDIARQCTEGVPKDRPTMEEVVAMLNKL
ncbi:hypothetical protein PR202_gb16686 [Eleusine coracana subsp. coracana]|uniref:Protein kinase domain-containing protein n=1 Tax=Eleusine coracana subsp. coracana TaxID=191504 RepID=A0AAV5F0H7_ELECO|nr:hypothetical protein PR202_gb16686 [Eleusine coracana subsp. coracana]